MSNWTDSARRQDLELTLEFRDEPTVARFSHLFQELWAGAKPFRSRAGGHQRRQELAPLGIAGVDARRALALVEPRPVEAVPIGRQRPAPRVHPAARRIAADHLRPELGQGHPAQRRGDEGRGLDDAHAFEQSIHELPNPLEACLFLP